MRALQVCLVLLIALHLVVALVHHRDSHDDPQRLRSRSTQACERSLAAPATLHAQLAARRNLRADVWQHHPAARHGL